jgi:hypothetical protein
LTAVIIPVVKPGTNRIALIELQKKANLEWERDHAEKARKAQAIPEETAVSILQKTERKVKGTERPAPNLLPPFISQNPALVNQPTVQELIGPAFSVSVFRKASNLQKYQQYRQQRDEEALILLLAA